jgi:hypothetical protein
MSLTQKRKKEQFAVMSFADLFGTGYLVQAESEVAAAVADGWEVLVENCDRETADHIAAIYKYAGKDTATPDLSDLLEHDYTEPQENRTADSVQEFDTIYTPIIDLDEYDADELATMRNALWVEGVITFIDEDTIELDGFLTIDRKIAEKYGELICKAVADCGFLVEYGNYLDQLNENMETLYAVALSEQTRLSNGKVA